MNIIVTGSLGNISQPLAQELIAKGHEVTIISSKADKVPAIEALGAKAAIGAIEDTKFLSSTFQGADAVYAMNPPNFAASDQISYYTNVAHSYAEAIKNTGVKRLVYLSSYGADLEKGNGIIRGSHLSEDILRQLEGVNVTFLRPGYFYYNLYHFLGMIKSQGIIGTNFGGEDKLVMVSPLDIASAAAEELTAGYSQAIRYIVSDERTCNEVAAMIGETIGKPGLQWLTFNDEQVRQFMLDHGRPAEITEHLVELGASIHNGLLRSDYEKHKPALGKTKLPKFLKEFKLQYERAAAH
ncbi:NAD(P)H-binding protein [Mucilaginibacter sp. cycad4]|uniref:NAD(P)H-binding protein n=1 Tax=Mucilaginibacter sp. cycad4 TaxID=3342096 RepID=UPI002AAB1197|nr:NAD(P)H-binding protein [Mucilaginibacter gossypii]WPV01641.1 NAD(P)H-binding protein [Mucilaginibacter gossypii]